MLRRAENVQVFYRRDLWSLLTGRHRILLQVGKREHLSSSRIVKSHFREMDARSASTPVRYMQVGERTYWRYDGRWYTDNDGLDHEAVHAVLVTRTMRQADQISRAKTIASQGQLPQQTRRGGIPDDVKQLVWNRDRGACRHCGSTTELQFDHIIPLAHGGSSTEENLQVLCGPCNRRKAAGLTVGAPAPSSGPPAPPPPSPPANWYPDPQGVAAYRYWDGHQWTDQTHNPERTDA